MDPSAIVGLMASAVAGLFGWVVKTQNDRITDRDRQIAALQLDNKEVTTELKVMALKVEQIITTEQDATRQELAELRKTNATLAATVAAATNRGVSS